MLARACVWAASEDTNLSRHPVLGIYGQKGSPLKVLNFVCQQISDMIEIIEFRKISAEIYF